MGSCGLLKCSLLKRSGSDVMYEPAVTTFVGFVVGVCVGWLACLWLRAWSSAEI